MCDKSANLLLVERVQRAESRLGDTGRATAVEERIERVHSARDVEQCCKASAGLCQKPLNSLKKRTGSYWSEKRVLVRKKKVRTTGTDD